MNLTRCVEFSFILYRFRVFQAVIFFLGIKDCLQLVSEGIQIPQICIFSQRNFSTNVQIRPKLYLFNFFLLIQVLKILDGGG